MFIIELLIRTFWETLYLTGAIILVGLLLGLLQNNATRNFQRSFGRNALMVTGFIGTPIHELSHAGIALLFGHKINDIKLFQRPDENGVMGYVNHSYNKNSLYQQIGNFFIGVAPIFGGIVAMIILMRLVIPEAFEAFITILVESVNFETFSMVTIQGIAAAYLGLLKIIFSWSNFQNLYFYLFLFIAICISSHMSLSLADIKGAFRGLLIIFLLVLIFNVLGLSQYIAALNVIKYNVFITGFLMITVIFSVITYFVSLASVLIARR
ncbi:hypothetical protein [Acetobacterium bakii]|uniref:Membrane protein n=1 Tax=Acetobacterium bakii TaxID=52689 RepID=A0A0L6TVX2_9FIRM|nr:hypothetical protein [Acetobacterium bakii]KNZ40409.1 membrane protein [Acetobacterium bakii]